MTDAPVYYTETGGRGYFFAPSGRSGRFIPADRIIDIIDDHASDDCFVFLAPSMVEQGLRVRDTRAHDFFDAIEDYNDSPSS